MRSLDFDEYSSQRHGNRINTSSGAHRTLYLEKYLTPLSLGTVRDRVLPPTQD